MNSQQSGDYSCIDLRGLGKKKEFSTCSIFLSKHTEKSLKSCEIYDE